MMQRESTALLSLASWPKCMVFQAGSDGSWVLPQHVVIFYEGVCLLDHQFHLKV